LRTHNALLILIVWLVALYSLVGGRFPSGKDCRWRTSVTGEISGSHGGEYEDGLMTEAASTFETLVIFYQIHGATTQKTAIFIRKSCLDDW
jgi:hypothetical protein